MGDQLSEAGGSRRDFFQNGMRWLAQAAIGHVPRKQKPVQRVLLRPPGALPEPQFLLACTRCGKCVEACPADAIFPWASGDPSTDRTPVIDARKAPCVVCDELACMTVCPSGALSLVAHRSEIDMGLAEVDHGLCARSHGEACTLCVDKCPLGAAAIRLDAAGRVEVVTEGCVGCGVCQWACPTQPESIRVVSTRVLGIGSEPARGSEPRIPGHASA